MQTFEHKKGSQKLYRIIQLIIQLHQSFANSKVNMVTLTQSKPNRQTRVNPNWSTASDVKIAPAKIASDGSGFFLCEVARAL